MNAIRESWRIPILQLDANVNPGISGGPVLNDRGQVVGIVVSEVNAVAELLKEEDLPEHSKYFLVERKQGRLRAALHGNAAIVSAKGHIGAAPAIFTIYCHLRISENPVHIECDKARAGIDGT